MTDMAYRVGLSGPSEALLPRWWRTVDKISLSAAALLFVVGLMLAFAASVPLAERNGLDPFHYVWRHTQFGVVALCVMVTLSVLRPRTVRRVGVLGFAVCLVAIALLPWFGTDFGKGNRGRKGQHEPHNEKQCRCRQRDFVNRAPPTR